jgi:hypothetical protein
MSGNAGSAKTWFQSGTCAGVYQEKESLEGSKRRKKDSLNQMSIMFGGFYIWLI